MTDNDRPGPDTPPPYVPAPGQPPAQPPRGQVRHQQAGVTQPRPPTLAEQRARAKAEHELRLAETAVTKRRAKTRKRLLIGGGVTVGVVALVAIWYAVTSPDNVTAQCTDQNGVVVDDDYCGDSYYRSHGGYSSNGFVYIGGSSYRYNYGGTGSVGQKISGGSYQLPKGANVSTKSGTSIQRGGFGLGGGGKSGGS